MKTYALYGAGNQSLNAEQTLRVLYPDMQAKWLIENMNFAKIGEKVRTWDNQSELEVISPECFAQLYRDGQAEAVFVSSGYYIFDLNKITHLMTALLVAPDDVLTLPVSVLRKPSEKLSEADQKIIPLSKLCQLTHLDIHIVDFCNLNCKACSHFAPLAKGRGLISAERYRKNLEQLHRKLPEIRDISVLGGEPLLNPELGVILRITREFYPYATIGLVSNGVLLWKMTDDVMGALRDCEITTVISLYPPLYEKIDEMISFLREKELRWHMIRVERFERKLFEKPWINGEEMTKNCGHVMCLRDRFIGRCATAMFVDYYNEAYGKNLPTKGQIDIYGGENGEELYHKLQQPLPLCNQCCARDHVFEPWEAMRNGGAPEDWMIRLPVEKM